MNQVSLVAFLIVGQAWGVTSSPNPSTFLSPPQPALSSDLSGPSLHAQEIHAAFPHQPERSLLLGKSPTNGGSDSNQLSTASPSDSADEIACKRILKAVESASSDWKGLYDCSKAKQLGKGKYATVFQVRGIPQKVKGASLSDHEPQTPQLYALRVSRIDESNTKESLEAEFKLLKTIDSPHIIKAYHMAVIPGETSKSEVFVSTLELANQGEFHDVSYAKMISNPDEKETDDQTNVEEDDYFYPGEPNPVLFYFKQMILAQLALDRAGYVGRDIKGQNMVLHDGILKYIDLASAIKKGQKSQIPAGTPFYTDPALFDQKKLEPIKKLCKEGNTESSYFLKDLMDLDNYKYGTYTDVYSLGMTLAFLIKGSEVYSKSNHKGEAESCQIYRAIEKTGIYFPIAYPIIFAYLLALMLRTDIGKRASLEQILYVIHLLGNEEWTFSPAQHVFLFDDKIKIAKFGSATSEGEKPKLVGDAVELPNFFKNEDLVKQQIENLYFKVPSSNHFDLDNSVYGDLDGGKNYKKTKTKIISDEDENGKTKILRYVYLVDPSAVKYRKVNAELQGKVVFDLPAFKKFFNIVENSAQDKKQRLLAGEELLRISASPSLGKWATGSGSWAVGIFSFIAIGIVIWVRRNSYRTQKPQVQILARNSSEIALEG